MNKLIILSFLVIANFSVSNSQAGPNDVYQCWHLLVDSNGILQGREAYATVIGPAGCQPPVHNINANNMYDAKQSPELMTETIQPKKSIEHNDIIKAGNNLKLNDVIMHAPTEPECIYYKDGNPLVF